MLFRFAELCAAYILLTTVIQKHVRSWGCAGARLEMLELKSSSRANQRVLKSHASAFEGFSSTRSSWAATSVLVPFSVPRCRFAVFNLHFLLRAGRDIELLRRSRSQWAVRGPGLKMLASYDLSVWLPLFLLTVFLFVVVVCCYCMTSWVCGKTSRKEEAKTLQLESS